MADFSVRSDSIDVDQVMRTIVERLQEKRGVDYTASELQHLASLSLERFLDPGPIRSNLVAEFRQRATSPAADEFSEAVLYETHRPWLRRIRRLLNPILKLFVNPAAVSRAMQARRETDVLFYELTHNLVVELTRMGIEIQNLKGRTEAIAGRIDFDERRARSFEGGARQVAQAPSPVLAEEGRPDGGDSDEERRQRRRRRQPGRNMADGMT